MTDQVFMRCDLAAIADWVTNFLKAPEGATGTVCTAIAADNGDPMVVLEFGGHEVAIEVWEARILIRVLISRDPASVGLCAAMIKAIGDIPQRTMH